MIRTLGVLVAAVFVTAVAGQALAHDPQLHRSVTRDPGLSDWASRTAKYGANSGAQVSLANFRKSLFLDVLNEAGQPARR